MHYILFLVKKEMPDWANAGNAGRGGPGGHPGNENRNAGGTVAHISD